MHLSGSFSYFPCAKSLRQSGRNLSISPMFETCNELRIKLHSIPENPAYDSVVNPKFLSHFEAQPHITPTLRIRLQPHFQAAEIDVEGISTDSLLTDVSPWSMSVPKLKKNPKLTPNSINNYFLSCLLFPTTARFLLMVLNAVKKLLHQRLQMATFKVLHCVGSMAIALFILLNCMPFILPLGSSASLRKVLSGVV